MNLTHIQQSRLRPLGYAVEGDVLTVNGAAFDFRALEEGDVLPRAAVAGDWLMSPVTRTGGEVRLEVAEPFVVEGWEPAAGEPGAIDWDQVRAAADAGETDLVARRAAMVCSRLQGRLVLGEAVCATLDALAADPTTPWAMRQTIIHAIEWQRLSPSMDELGWIVSLDDLQKDALFQQAMTVAV